MTNAGKIIVEIKIHLFSLTHIDKHLFEYRYAYHIIVLIYI